MKKEVHGMQVLFLLHKHVWFMKKKKFTRRNDLIELYHWTASQIVVLRCIQYILKNTIFCSRKQSLYIYKCFFF